MSSPSPSQTQLNNIQALRGIACLLVIVYHVAGMEKHAPGGFKLLTPFLTFGFAGVDLFFVISGFIIAHTWKYDQVEPRAAGRFLFRRFWRVLPLHWIWQFGFAVPLMACRTADCGTNVRHSIIPTLWLDPQYTNQFNPATWTLSFEMAFYVAFALIMLIPNSRFKVGFVIALAIAIIGTVFFKPLPDDSYGNVVAGPFVLEFLLGVGIAFVQPGFKRPHAWLALAFGAIWCVGMGHWLGLWQNPILINNKVYRIVIFGVPAGCIVLAALAFERSGSLVKNRFLLASGDASYSIYLTHMAMHGFLNAVFLNLNWSHLRPFHIMYLAIIFSATFAVGFAFHTLVEKPLLNWIKPKAKLKLVPAEDKKDTLKLAA